MDTRLKETYCWLLIPYIDSFDMRALQWDTIDMGGGSDRIVEKAAREMKQAEQIISAWAPAP